MPPAPDLVNDLYQEGLLPRLIESHLKSYQPAWQNDGVSQGTALDKVTDYSAVGPTRAGE